MAMSAVPEGARDYLFCGPAFAKCLAEQVKAFPGMASTAGSKGAEGSVRRAVCGIGFVIVLGIVSLVEKNQGDWSIRSVRSCTTALATFEQQGREGGGVPPRQIPLRA